MWCSVGKGRYSCPVATMWRVKGLLCVVMETVTGICVFCVLEELEGGVEKVGKVLVARGRF